MSFLESRYFSDHMPQSQAIDVRDSERWGLSTFRMFPESRDDLRAHEDSFVIARIDANRMDLVQYALKIGYLLCDTLTHWKGKCSEISHQPLADGYWDRPVKDDDSDAMLRITEEAFDDYPSHYRNDIRTRDKSVAPYMEWAKSIKTGIVVEHERCEFPHVHRDVIAYGLFSRPCELALAAVDKAHNGKGLYAHLVGACAHWGIKNGLDTIEISTQVTNLAVQKVWARLGLSPYKHVYTLHRWP